MSRPFAHAPTSRQDYGGTTNSAGRSSVTSGTSQLAPATTTTKKKTFFPPIYSKKWFAGTFILPLLSFLLALNLLVSHYHHTSTYTVSVIIYLIWAVFFLFIWYQGYWWRLDRLSKVKWRFITVLLVGVGFYFGLRSGDSIYHTYSFGEYSYQDLAQYIAVDPAIAKGQSYMDSGRMQFKSGVRVATEAARMFKEKHNYCVAPIVGQPLTKLPAGNFELPASGTIDFWAVGVDCCNSEKKFECGPVTDVLARSGMRLLRHDQRPFFRLAVEQWSAEFQLPVAHPLFFYWVRDPQMASETYQSSAQKNLWIHTGVFFLSNSLMAFLLYLFIPEIGPNSSHSVNENSGNDGRLVDFQKKLFGVGKYATRTTSNSAGCGEV